MSFALGRVEHALTRLIPVTVLDHRPVELMDGEWDSLLALARRHKVAPMVWWSLTARIRRTPGPDIGSPPEGIVAAFSGEAERTRAQDVVIHSGMCSLATAFARRSIPFVALKGAVFSETLYPRPGLRPMADIDILLDRVPLPRLTRTMADAGFVPREEKTSEGAYVGYFHVPFVRAEPPELMVEVHHALTNPGRYRIDPDELFRRCRPVQERGAPGWGTEGVLSLCPEDAILFSALHLCNHLFTRIDLRSYVDLHELVCQWDPDWDLLTWRAKRWGLAGALHLCLSIARSLFNTPTPDEAMADLKPWAGRRRWLQGLVRPAELGAYRFPGHGTDLARVVLGMPLIDRWSQRVAYSGRYLGSRLAGKATRIIGRS